MHAVLLPFGVVLSAYLDRSGAKLGRFADWHSSRSERGLLDGGSAIPCGHGLQSATFMVSPSWWRMVLSRSCSLRADPCHKESAACTFAAAA